MGDGVATQFFPMEGCLASATATRTAMASSILHCFKSDFVPEPTDPLSAYTAAEADYAGYDPITLTAWNVPLLAPGNGYMIASPLAQFTWTAEGEDVGNIIGGVYLVDSGGKARMTIIFTEPVPMQQAGQGFPLYLVWLFPTGQ